MLGEAFEPALHAAQAGAEWAWSSLYEDLSPQVLGYLRGHGAREPEDLLGETWLQVARNISGFRGGEGEFRAWVFTIARHRLVDERRYLSRRPQSHVDRVPEDSVIVEDIAGRAIDTVAGEQIRGLLDRLTPDQRDVLMLRILGGLTIPEISTAMGKRVGAVKQLQRRGLLALVALAEKEGVPLGSFSSVTGVT